MKSKELREQARTVLADALKTGTKEQQADLAIKILSLPPNTAHDE